MNKKIIKRCEQNPILSSKDMPYESDLVFNPGVTKYKGKYLMVFRNDYGCDRDTLSFKGTNLGIAHSDDGIDWIVENEPFFTKDMIADKDFIRFYDPRLIVIEEELYMCFAIDSMHGIRGGIGRISDDLKKTEIISVSGPDNRNFVLFPEKVNGQYIRLECPMPVYGKGGKFDIWMSKSNDLKYWGETKLMLGVENVPFANDKIGPAAPPIKTDKGWLTIFHAVDRDDSRGKNGWESVWTKRYTAGIMLSELENPSKIIGMAKEPVIVPEAIYETDNGFRNDVIFPCGMIDEGDGTVKIYYGAADTVICMATAKIDELIDLCLGKNDCNL